MSAVRKILGTYILRDKKVGRLYLNHKWYIEDVFHMFNMLTARAISIPLGANFKDIEI